MYNTLTVAAILSISVHVYSTYCSCKVWPLLVAVIMCGHCVWSPRGNDAAVYAYF